MKGYVSLGIGVVMLLIASTNSAGQTTTAESQRHVAITLEQEGKNSQAATAWRAFLKAQPGNAEAYAHLGFLEARQEHYKQAVPLYRKALALDPAMPGLQMNLGLSLFKAGELKDAIHIFGQLLNSQSPDSPEVQRLKTLMGLAYYGLQDYAAAVPFLKDATASDPQNLPFRLVLAHSCLGAKQYQCVLDVYHEILTLNAESAEADMLAGEALDEMNDHEGATQQFQAAVKVNPREPNVHFGLGYLLWTQNQYEEAAHEFQAELNNVPNNAQAFTYLADCHIKLNQSGVALPLLQKAIQLAPQMELAHLDLGILHASAGRNPEALRELKLAAHLDPTDMKPHWRLARLYQAMGQKDDANSELEKTRNLTKADEDSVFDKLKQVRGEDKPADKPADSPAKK